MSPPAVNMTCTCCCFLNAPIRTYSRNMFSIKTTGWLQTTTDHVQRASEKVWRGLWPWIFCVRDLACQLVAVCLECSALRLQCIRATFSITAGPCRFLSFSFISLISSSSPSATTSTTGVWTPQGIYYSTAQGWYPLIKSLPWRVHEPRHP